MTTNTFDLDSTIANADYDTLVRIIEHIVYEYVPASQLNELNNDLLDIVEGAQLLDDEHDQFLNDVEADADALAQAGYGTDEDYGYYGGED